jgi:hypothetical protein
MNKDKHSLLWDDKAFQQHQDKQLEKSRKRQEARRKKSRKPTAEELRYVSAADAKKRGRLKTEKNKLPNSVLEEMALKEMWAREAKEILAYEKKVERLREERALAEMIYEEGSGLRPSDRTPPIKEETE